MPGPRLPHFSRPFGKWGILRFQPFVPSPPRCRASQTILHPQEKAPEISRRHRVPYDSRDAVKREENRPFGRTCYQRKRRLPCGSDVIAEELALERLCGNVSQCPYCRRELPGFETLCQDCFEAGYDQVLHPIPWWRRMRLTYNSLYVFLFVFFYVLITTSVNRDHHPTMVGLVFLALTVTAGMILISFVLGDFRKPKVSRSRGLWVFLLLFLYIFFRLWKVSSYHPVPNPGLWAFVAATIAAIVESFSADRGQNARPQK
jgi:hypothetical protein